MTLQIILVSILPRLDICGNDLEAYKVVVKEITLERQCMFLGAIRHYPMIDRRFWPSRDSVNIISDFSIPIIVAVLSRHLRRFLEKQFGRPFYHYTQKSIASSSIKDYLKTDI